MYRLKAEAWQQDFKRTINILLFRGDPQGEIYAVQHINIPELKKIVPGDQVEPTFKLDIMTAQSLVDALYRELGIVPNDVKNRISDGNNLLAAKNYHLEDMRKLVFKELREVCGTYTPGGAGKLGE